MKGEIIMNCPWCNSEKYDCEYVDVGVGRVPCSPKSCYDCGAHEFDWRDEGPEGINQTATEEENKKRVWRGFDRDEWLTERGTKC